ncbi:MAG: glycosyltransferase family 2 protein [Chlorobia bacterium]|nr:glycosyltransferase family 2 protein [Fimbriimonadaceae bacterium]
MAESNVSVIVVSFNTKEKLRRCLECIEPEDEAIVVDNASSDGSAEMVESDFPLVHLIKNSENRGFGAANNQGLDVMTHSLALFLNSDCYADPGAIQRLAQIFRDQDVVAAGGRLENPDGSFQLSVADRLTLWKVFLEQSFLELVLRPFGLGYWFVEPFEETRVVPQVMGACLMIRPLERFDERYFLYCEDTDLCRRLTEHGKIVYEPSARFTHELGSSSSGTGRWKSVARYNRGKELYFSIHHGPFASRICLILDRCGALLRLTIWLVLAILTLGLVKRFRDQVVLFARVLSSPIQGPDRDLHIPR